MFDFSKCRPVELDDLVRVGNDFDGGYVIPMRATDKTKILLSFGVNNDWTFEEGFSKLKDVKIYSYDYSTKLLPFMKRNSFEICAAILLKGLLGLNKRWFLYYLNMLRSRIGFNKFFDPKNGRRFIPKFIGIHDDEKNTCFKTIFEELGEVEDLSVFIKMDIEGGEYLCLPCLAPYWDKINGLVIEFHDLKESGVKFEELLDALSSRFYVAHTHGNNHSELIYKTEIPSVLEMSFINKKLAPKDIKLCDKEHPIKGLDAPCNKFREDYALKFTE
ncbi:MAG: hypothetical protein LBC53_04180 [Spirochaetaceae bacterium]|jgi:hypothetical protein|nr:hypothetical protein [Spirochaetaceae bacterium]